MKRKKPNIIDIILVIVILLIAAAALFRMFNIKQLPDTVKDREVTYTLSVSDIDSAYAGALVPGDKLYLTGKALYCGEVTGIVEKYAEKEVVYPDGSVADHLYPRALTLKVDVKISADIAENGFYVGENTFLSLGTQLDLYSETFSFPARITNIVHTAG